MGKVILSGMHHIGRMLNFHVQREFQNRGTEHMHSPIHKVDAPKIEEYEYSEVAEFTDKSIICSLPDETKYPAIRKLVKKLKTHYHATTCKKKKDVTSRINATLAPTDKTRTVRFEEKIDEALVKQSRKLIDKVLSNIVTISDLSDATLSEHLEECGVKPEQYENALGCVEKKVSISYKQKPSEVSIEPYNTVILKFLRSNMNLQFITSAYAKLTYLM